jgi:hypothetical protein
VIVALVLLALAGPVLAADPPRLPEGVTCDHVRAVVKEHGKVKALAMALQHGATAAEIRAGWRCLKSR